MPQFVLLHHECPTGVPRPTHWDFMLQSDAALRTWVLVELPSDWLSALDLCTETAALGASTRSLAAEEIQPHRLDYLDFQGPLAGDRGSVLRLDRGTFETLAVDDCRVAVQLKGDRLRGELMLTREHPQTPHWRLSFSAAMLGRE